MNPFLTYGVSPPTKTDHLEIYMSPSHILIDLITYLRIANSRKWDKRNNAKEMKDDKQLENPLDEPDPFGSGEDMTPNDSSEQPNSNPSEQRSSTDIQVNLEVEQFREAGCMIQFIVARVTISMKYAKLLGQQCFPDYFVGALDKYKHETQLPMPMWMKVSYVCLVGFFVLIVLAWKKGIDNYNNKSLGGGDSINSLETGNTILPLEEGDVET